MKPSTAVRVREEQIVLPTYEPHAPDRNPMFLEKRVYQGSSGCVYPLPFIDRIAERPTPRAWRAIFLENEFLEVMILPELGGRIHAGRDKTNGYDFFYRQNVIKPALVGLAGPWISGGVEFNWAQHHRPATFLPVEAETERHADGSVTVWLGDHEPMSRMKGLHGVCLHPGRAVVEVKVRVFNRTALTQTFLWWANVGVRVHEKYQSFFPPDVTHVADHARRTTSTFPLCQGKYYGVDYGERARRGVPAGEAPRRFVPDGGYAPNDLSWYANIPVPTSYMAMGSKEDFFGGYDHAREAGLVHVADHRISPGKKQWTWGNHEFGYAWDRNLTDADGPYIELMAGVFTDNQPDFSFLGPGETKSWSQFWYPIREIGPADHANVEAALSLAVEGRTARVGVSVTSRRRATIQIEARGRRVASWRVELAPGKSAAREATLLAGVRKTDLRVTVSDEGGEVISYAPKTRMTGDPPPPATEPPSPSEIASTDELFVTGLHLEQYRHATRSPEPYWREALRRDPGDARCHNALGLRRLRRGEFAAAERHFRSAIARLTLRNPNPSDGGPFYHLGVVLRFLGRDAEAGGAFAKAAWNQAWQAPAWFAMAEIACAAGRFAEARGHLEQALRRDTDDLRVRNLLVMVRRRLGSDDGSLLRETLARDPLDGWARFLDGRELRRDGQLRLDLALDFSRAGFFEDAIAVLGEAAGAGVEPLRLYYLGSLHERDGRRREARRFRERASVASRDYCFPARIEEIVLLESALRANPRDASAWYYLGNLLYDKRRHEEGIACWEKSARLDPGHSVVWRNLGIGLFNIRRDPKGARSAYDRAFRANPRDARVLYERDQLWKRLACPPGRRLRELERHRDLVASRDDLCIEMCALHNQTGRSERAREILATRKFQPWEGGEGQALGQHVRTQLVLGRRALARAETGAALSHFRQALDVPENLGEARHLLANASDIHYWLGCAHQALGQGAAARRHWRTAASFRGDFQEMSVRAYSEMTRYSALALCCLGRPSAAERLFRSLRSFARGLARATASIDYFATSLPTMLIFEDDLQARQVTTALFLEAQAEAGLGRRTHARRLLQKILERDPNHALARDLSDELL